MLEQPTGTITFAARSLRVLLVEDDPLVARALRRLLERCEVRVCSSCREARACMGGAQSWDALIFDVELPDGLGTDLLADVREAGDWTPALVITAYDDPEYLRLAQLRQAMFARKGIDAESLDAFIRWVRARPTLTQVVRWRARQWKLSPRQTAVLVLALRGLTSKEIAEAMEIGEPSVRTHVRRLVRKAGKERFQDVIADVQRDAWDA